MFLSLALILFRTTGCLSHTACLSFDLLLPFGLMPSLLLSTASSYLSHHDYQYALILIYHNIPFALWSFPQPFYSSIIKKPCVASP